MNSRNTEDTRAPTSMLANFRAVQLTAIVSTIVACGGPLSEDLPNEEQATVVSELHRRSCRRGPNCARSRFVRVLDSYMHYREAGDPNGAPIILMHGQPTWSYLYRNIIPRLPSDARIIAPDSIGYGFSGRPDIDYSWLEHVEYMEAFIQTLGLQNVTLVVHDHGSFQGLAYAQRNPLNVRGIVMMESILGPLPPIEQLIASTPPGTPRAEFFDFLAEVRASPAASERLIVDDNLFVEEFLPDLVIRRLSRREMRAYRWPFRSRRSRIKLQTIPLGIPLGGVPAENHAFVSAYAQYLATSNVPKLILYANPGFIFSPQTATMMASMLPNTTAESVGAGLHFIQEDQPRAIAGAISRFYRGL